MIRYSAGCSDGEAEVRLEAEELGLEARRALRRSLAHRVTDATVEVDHQLDEDRALRVEVEIEGAGSDAGGVGHLDDRRLREPELAEHRLGRVEQSTARVEPASGTAAGPRRS